MKSQSKADARVIGGGLAGVEAAYHLAQLGMNVDLYEMRPTKMTPAHKTQFFAELVCSNSLKGTDPSTAHGLLKKEMRALDSIVLKVADATKVPAGRALAVDRVKFAETLTEIISSHENIRIIREETRELRKNIPTIVATGPLSSDAIISGLKELTSSEGLFFYDAISPIVDGDSIDKEKTFFSSRWSRDDTSYLNCPMDKDQYISFVEELLKADRLSPHPFESKRFFESCMPIEVLAQRGVETLRYGPMRPVGLVNPRTGGTPYAVVQLRRENLKGDAFNMVGFQTRLTYTSQQRVFRMIPGLETAHFLRYGSVHRNTFIDSPRLLRQDLSLKGTEHIFVAGQLTGVEGYMESASMGILAAISACLCTRGYPFVPPPPTTAMGALLHYITDPRSEPFQPMNINFGIMEDPGVKGRKRKVLLLEREARDFSAWMHGIRNRLG